MKREDLKLHTECLTCVLKDKGTCKGKETHTPCLAYKSREQYGNETILKMRESVARVKEHKK